jgi:hypothetical protein
MLLDLEFFTGGGPSWPEFLLPALIAVKEEQ